MDSEDSESSGLDSSPFTKRILHSPRLMPKAADAGQPLCLSSSSSGRPSSDSAFQRPVPDGGAAGLSEAPGYRKRSWGDVFREVTEAGKHVTLVRSSSLEEESVGERLSSSDPRTAAPLASARPRPRRLNSSGLSQSSAPPAETAADLRNNQGSRPPPPAVASSPSPVPVPRKPRCRRSQPGQAGKVTEQLTATPGDAAPGEDNKVLTSVATDAVLDEGEGLDLWPGFEVRQVVLQRAEGESLGLGIVPSYGCTRNYYQIKRLLADGVWAKASSNFAVGDCLLACNGRSLKGLTQGQCLEVLKSAGSFVTLTILHQPSDGETHHRPAAEPFLSPTPGPRLSAGAPLDGCVALDADVLHKESSLLDGGVRSCESSQDDSWSESVTDSECCSVSEDLSFCSQSEKLPAATKARHFRDTTADATMSNPFLDDAVDAPPGGAVRLDKTNPFYQDLLEQDFPSSMQPEAGIFTTPPPAFFDIFSNPSTTSMSTELSSVDVLLDLSDGDDRTRSLVNEEGGKTRSNAASETVSVPPPAEFSDLAEIFGALPSAPKQAPVTNIDDLLGVEFSEVQESRPLLPQTAAQTACQGSKGSSGLSDEGFDLLVDADEARQETRTVSDLEEDPLSPPPVPTSTFPGVPSVRGLHSDDLVSAVFVPSDNPADNVSVVPVTDGGVAAGVDRDSGESIVHVTDIIVSPFQPQMSTVTVSGTKPSQCMPPSSVDLSPPGSTVIRLNGEANAVSARIQFDNSEPDEAGGMGQLSSAPAPSCTSHDLEEEILPMAVQQDEQGNRLAIPATPQTLKKPTPAARQLDKTAKQDLASVMSEMSNWRPLARSEKDARADRIVQEEEINPVMLTRREADIMQKVFASWVAGEKREPSSTAPRADSGFRRAAESIIEVQTGRADLPENAVFHTTLGITRLPKTNERGEVKDDDEEEVITPMSVLKDHQGNKHYIPSTEKPVETIPRTLDECAKRDIAAVMGTMDASTRRRKLSHELETENRPIVEEESIKCLVLTGAEREQAMAAVSRWLVKESGIKQTPPSGFHRVVGIVMDLQSKEELPATTLDSQDDADGNLLKETKEWEKLASRDFGNGMTCSPADSTGTGSVEELTTTSEPEMNVYCRRPLDPPVHSASSQPEIKARQASAQTHAKQKAAGSGVDRGQSNSGLSKTYYAELRPVSKITEQTRLISGSLPELRPASARNPASRPTSMASVEMRPVAGRRSLQAPARLSIGSAFLSKAVGRTALQPSSLARSSRGEYSKTRCNDAPFLVEFLSGILGLGVKVNVTPEGHVRVTDIQRNSPADKNGNLRVGDYILRVNTTELTGQSEGRVQQVFRLLPRGLVKLLVTTQPPTTANQSADGPLSPRPGGNYTPFGVRLSPLPFATQSSNTSPVTVASDPAGVGSPTQEPEQTSHTTVTAGENEEDEDMAGSGGPYRLSKALSPRNWNASFEAPKPTPRQKAAVPSSPTKVSSASTAEEGEDNAVAYPRRPERNTDVSDFVTVAARRPSGRGEDLPPPPDVCQPQVEVGGNTVTVTVEENMFPEQSVSHTVSILTAARHPSGGDSLRDEVLPVFAEAAKKLTPTPVPRNKFGTPTKRRDEDAEEPASTNLGISHAERQAEAPVKEEIITTKSTIHCHGVPKEAPPLTRVPPPVAPKPSRLPDHSPLPAHANNGVVEAVSPTFVSPRLSEFVDPDAASPEEQLKCRKFVSSAARMFEEKGTEQKPMPQVTKRIKSSLDINSVIQSFNREAEPEPLMMRKASSTVASSPDSKHINSALLPARDKRKSMPPPTAVPSSGLTKPASLTQFKEINATSRVSDMKHVFAQKVTEEGTPERSPRINAALQPRHPPHIPEWQEDHHVSSLPQVGKAEQVDLSVKSRSHSRSSVHPLHEHDSLEHLSSSLSGSAQETPDDAKQPKMVFSSRSLHHGDRRSWSPSTNASWQTGGSDGLVSTMRQFDDLLSDKHPAESDVEHLRVSNSVSLDLESWNASRGAGRSKAKEEAQVQVKQTLSQESSAADNSVDSATTQKDAKMESAANLREPEILSDVSSGAAAQVLPVHREENEAEKRGVTELIQSTVTQALGHEKMATEKANDSGRDVPKEDNSEDVVYKVIKVQVHQSPEMLNDIITQKAIMKIDEEPHEDQRENRDHVEKESPPTQNEDKYPEVNSPELTLPSHHILEQHASALVETVLKNALSDTSLSKSADFDASDTALSTPPLSEEEPPPLPGAPPPPLILRDKAHVLITAADLEEMLQASDAEQTPIEPSEADREFTDLDKSPRCNQLVSDTVSVDSGVLDEDMPEDSLRFSQDDSPTTSGEASTFELAITPDEIIASVVLPAESAPSSRQTTQDHLLLVDLPDHTGAKGFKCVSDLPGNGAANINSDVSLNAYQMSPVTVGVCVSPSLLSQSTFTAAALEESRLDDFSDSEVSNFQGSHSPKCSSVPQVLEPVPLGGASTTGSDVCVETEDLPESPSAVTSASAQDLVLNEEQNQSSAIDVLSSGGAGDVTPAASENENSTRSYSLEARDQVISSDQKPAKLMTTTQEDFVELVSPRALHFLDPSGSLFLQCPANSPVSLSTSTLGHVSLLHPHQLVDLVAKVNEELTSAKLPASLELKLVAAQNLDGGLLKVDVTQREDYFVQVTRVKSSGSAVQEADLLLSVDCHTMRYKRPAQLHTALENTDPKSILLIARGLKLKVPLAANGGLADKEASLPPPPLPSSFAPEVMAVGVFDVFMMKGATGVGFCLEGGKASPLGDFPIVIKRIFKGGPAEKCGQLKVKDEILAVNGVDFTNMRHYEAWNHLKFLDDGEIRITIRRK